MADQAFNKARRDEILAEVKGSGKFAGCSVADWLMYEMSLDGASASDTVANEGWGDSATLLEGPLFDATNADHRALTAGEQTALAGHAGCIVRESSDGLITVDYFECRDALDAEWDATVTDFEPEDEDEEGSMKLVRDLTVEFRMPCDSFAGIFRDEQGGYRVAWGKGYDLLRNDPPAYYDGPNTPEDGITESPFDTLEDAEAYVRSVADANAQTD